MAFDRSQDDPYHHSGGCRTKHRKGHWCWTKDELETLQVQYELLRRNPGCPWPTIALEFTIQGFVRHNSFDCFKMWCQRFRNTKTKIKVEEDYDL